MIKNIIFDIDGTITDTKIGTLKSLRRVLIEETGKSFHLAELERYIGIPGRLALQKLGISDCEKCNERWNDYFYSTPEALKLFDGIKPAIQMLSAIGINLGIVTSKDESELRKGFYGSGVENYFPLIISFNDTTLHKPNPQPIMEYLRRTGVNAKETIYIGDTIYDKECAKKSGILFGLAGWGAVNVPTDDCEYVFETPSDIFDCIINQNSYEIKKEHDI